MKPKIWKNVCLNSGCLVLPLNCDSTQDYDFEEVQHAKAGELVYFWELTGRNIKDIIKLADIEDQKRYFKRFMTIRNPHERNSKIAEALIFNDGRLRQSLLDTLSQSYSSAPGPEEVLVDWREAESFMNAWVKAGLTPQDFIEFASQYVNVSKIRKRLLTPTISNWNEFHSEPWKPAVDVDNDEEFAKYIYGNYQDKVVDDVWKDYGRTFTKIGEKTLGDVARVHLKEGAKSVNLTYTTKTDRHYKADVVSALENYLAAGGNYLDLFNAASADMQSAARDYSIINNRDRALCYLTKDQPVRDYVEQYLHKAVGN